MVSQHRLPAGAINASSRHPVPVSAVPGGVRGCTGRRWGIPGMGGAYREGEEFPWREAEPRSPVSLAARRHRQRACSVLPPPWCSSASGTAGPGR